MRAESVVACRAIAEQRRLVDVAVAPRDVTNAPTPRRTIDVPDVVATHGYGSRRLYRGRRQADEEIVLDDAAAGSRDLDHCGKLVGSEYVVRARSVRATVVNTRVNESVPLNYDAARGLDTIRDSEAQVVEVIRTREYAEARDETSEHFQCLA